MVSEQRNMSSLNQQSSTREHIASARSRSPLTNAYYLHLGGNPILIVVSPPRNENNYDIWSRHMKCALVSEN